MNASPFLPPDDDPVSFPSMPTLHGGDPNALGRIDHYDLLRKLGGGGFGVVYLAKDSNSGVEVALKTLHPLLKTNAEEMDALREKFALVSRLTHTNIAKALVLHPVRDVNIWDETARKEMRLSPGDSVMVMDYAPGVTLSRWRRQFPDGIVPLDLALDIARQVASALDYAHGERIVHRDIKPGNVMVETLGDNAQCRMHNAQCNAQGGASRPGEPPLVTRHPSLVTSRIRARILDFGLAAEIRSSMSRVSTETGDTSGTRPYMAPEQWLGKKQDGRTDQYALACVLYEMLSGAPPFAGVFETGDPMIMMTTVENRAPEEIEDVPEAVNAALLQALAKKPKDRYSSCTEFVAALDETTKDTKYTNDDVGTARSSSAPHNGGASRPGEPPNAAELEADVLRRKLSLARAIKAISAEDRADSEFSALITNAEDELVIAEEACKFGRFAAAVQCLDRAEAASRQLQQAKDQRKVREEAERKAFVELEPKLSAGERKVVEIAPGITIALRWCPSTTSESWKTISGGDDFYWMGSPKGETGRSKNENRHPVRLTHGFWMGETPVTQGQWEAVMGNNPSEFLDGKNWLGFGGQTSPNRPVERISWYDCEEFLNTLNKKAPLPGYKWRLPTEAQWEYACRAGTTEGAYAGAESLEDMGWYGKNSDDTTHPVGLKKTNSWGFHDMHGNVYEWCADWYGSYSTGIVTDPTGADLSAYRVRRGGSWLTSAWLCRSANRGSSFPDYRGSDFGLRIVAIQNESEHP